ncbi:C40 family peptidase [Actinomyces dentalis]|uniref:C40 family peptidase n=1 Tax=Actinomyces dentalis TaxID=272548 RepID=UPI00042A3461|nr:C40 family peptidase [Actinomyces dentalis]
MTSRNLARHRKAARPLTPLSDAAPALRRGLVVAASSGLALTMITSAANAAGGNTQSLERSAGALGIGPATAKAEALITQNTPIEVDADVVADADTPATSEVATEAPGPSEEELAAQAAAEQAAEQAAAEQAQAEQAAAEQAAAEQAAEQAQAEQAAAEQAAAEQAQAEQAAAEQAAAEQAQAEQAAAEQAQAAPAVSTEDEAAESTAVPASSAVPQGVGSDAVAIGSNYLGTPYAWGGGAPGGFDCSGFVSYVYAQMGISLPHQSGDILNSGTVISASEARPGDILWWPGHVGIYAGDGQVLHSTPGPGVSITNIWGSPTYLRVG